MQNPIKDLISPLVLAGLLEDATILLVAALDAEDYKEVNRINTEIFPAIHKLMLEDQALMDSPEFKERLNSYALKNLMYTPTKEWGKGEH